MSEPIYITRSSMPPYEEYVRAIRPLWDSHWLTNMGKYHMQLEAALADYLAVPELSLVVNGHMALELAIQSFAFPAGSEIITTPFTFISTTHAIVRNRLKPVFCDVKETDGTIDETKIEDLITSRTVAILPVHVYGNICHVEEIQRIASRHGLKVIYDAAHAFGETCKGEGIGNFGDASIFSFHATKVFNTIEGGAVVCREHALYEKLYNLKNFGIRGEEEIESIGANAKMNEFCAIMGLCNLRRVEQAIQSRKEIFTEYSEKISQKRGVRSLVQPGGEKRNYSYFPILVEDDFPYSRDQLYERFRREGIFTRKYFYPLTSDCGCYRGGSQNETIPVARAMADRVLTLPIYEGMEKEDRERVVSVLLDT